MNSIVVPVFVSSAESPECTKDKQNGWPCAVLIHEVPRITKRDVTVQRTGPRAHALRSPCKRNSGNVDAAFSSKNPRDSFLTGLQVTGSFEEGFALSVFATE